MGFKTRIKDQAEQDITAAARVRDALEGYLASHGPEVKVSVTHVLDLLNPRGMWSFDPARRQARQQAAEAPPATADAAGGDPLTGCKPVSAPPRER
jgi:hypothetical protein